MDINEIKTNLESYLNTRFVKDEAKTLLLLITNKNFSTDKLKALLETSNLAMDVPCAIHLCNSSNGGEFTKSEKESPKNTFKNYIYKFISDAALVQRDKRAKKNITNIAKEIINL